MILTTHILIGAAMNSGLGISNPAAAFLISTASHYLSDKIPHWQYKIKSNGSWDPNDIQKSRKKSAPLADYLLVGGDALVGFLIILAFIRPTSWTGLLFWALISFGAVLPDFLQFLYRKIDNRFLAVHKKFHDFWHSKIDLDPYARLGIPSQIILDLIALYVLIF